MLPKGEPVRGQKRIDHAVDADVGEGPVKHVTLAHFNAAMTVTRSDATGLRERMKSVEDLLKKMSARLDGIEPQTIEATLRVVEPRVDTLATRINALLVRDCVFTEVMRSVKYGEREFILRSLLLLWDEPDAYWLKRSNERWTIAWWRRYLTALAANPDLRYTLEPAKERAEA